MNRGREKKGLDGALSAEAAAAVAEVPEANAEEDRAVIS